MRLTGINLHPVKSTAVRPVDSAAVRLHGLAGDRRWMLVDGGGTMVTARKTFGLLAITAEVPETGGTSTLRLSAPGQDPIEVEQPSEGATPVRLFRYRLTGRPAAPKASAWVGRVLGRDDVTLVWCDDPTRRQLSPTHSRPGDHAAFQDGYPLTVATEASLARLNEWIADEAEAAGRDAETIPMQRFRPNLVVAGSGPFEEDEWSALQIGDLRLRVASPNARCVLTTVDPQTQVQGKEPMRTLARHRRRDRKTLFALNLIPEGEGRLHVGDTAVALRPGD